MSFAVGPAAVATTSPVRSHAARSAASKSGEVLSVVVGINVSPPLCAGSPVRVPVVLSPAGDPAGVSPLCSLMGYRTYGSSVMRSKGPQCSGPTGPQ